VVLQLPRNAGPIASKRIADALKQGLEANAENGLSAGRRNLYVILTELARVSRR